uniref:Major facilitator superfamily (MFS) profile domain-containing protein n=1 Tax=Anopheles maculatus TaxID=74869 RepID=A0A182SWF0_9DIPT
MIPLLRDASDISRCHDLASQCIGSLTMDLTLPVRGGVLPAGRIQFNESGWTFRLVALGAITTLGASIPVGYGIGVINAPSEFIKHWSSETIFRKYDVQLTDSALRAFVAAVISIALIGGVIGSLQGAYLADKYG